MRKSTPRRRFNEARAFSAGNPDASFDVLLVLRRFNEARAFSAGNPGRDDHGVREPVASMRPAHSAREIGDVRRRRVVGSSGFNEARAFSAGNHTALGVIGSGWLSLQ